MGKMGIAIDALEKLKVGLDWGNDSTELYRIACSALEALQATPISDDLNKKARKLATTALEDIEGDSRHETLWCLVYDALLDIAALPPAPASAWQDAIDARRYRWLRNEANGARKSDPMVCMCPLGTQKLIDGIELDAAIDAVMLPPVPTTQPVLAEQNYAALEKEHLGDPDLKTGIYAQPVQAEPVTISDEQIAKLAEKHLFVWEGEAVGTCFKVIPFAYELLALAAPQSPQPGYICAQKVIDAIERERTGKNVYLVAGMNEAIDIIRAEAGKEKT